MLHPFSLDLLLSFFVLFRRNGDPVAYIMARKYGTFWHNIEVRKLFQGFYQETKGNLDDFADFPSRIQIRQIVFTVDNFQAE